MTETLLFVRLGNGQVYRNVVRKLQKCQDRVGGDYVTHRVRLHLAQSS